VKEIAKTFYEWYNGKRKQIFVTASTIHVFRAWTLGIDFCCVSIMFLIIRVLSKVLFLSESMTFLGAIENSVALICQSLLRFASATKSLASSMISALNLSAPAASPLAYNGPSSARTLSTGWLQQKDKKGRQ
jgi:hypothetical protein